MCLTTSKTSFIAFMHVGIYLMFLVKAGMCDDDNLTTARNQESIKGSKKLSHQHAPRWKGWEEWLPSSVGHEHDRSIRNPYIPLSPSHQSKFQFRRNMTENSVAGFNKPKRSKTTKDKTGNESTHEGDSSSVGDLRSIKETALKFAATVLNHFATQLSKPSESDNSIYGATLARDSRVIKLDNLGNRQDGPNVGRPEPEARRGVIDWLARLIGVQGKTLGEFLREYQVHVLYDLAFTFFKWIFFLYAGLLIP